MECSHKLLLQQQHNSEPSRIKNSNYGRYSRLCQQPHRRANKEISVHVDEHVNDPVSSDVRLCSDDET